MSAFVDFGISATSLSTKRAGRRNQIRRFAVEEGWRLIWKSFDIVNLAECTATAIATLSILANDQYLLKNFRCKETMARGSKQPRPQEVVVRPVICARRPASHAAFQHFMVRKGALKTDE